MGVFRRNAGFPVSVSAKFASGTGFRGVYCIDWFLLYILDDDGLKLSLYNRGELPHFDQRFGSEAEPSHWKQSHHNVS
jgi:hypothetical protein